jgi:uncharacterized protein YndB with AHSA1/START domain
MPDSTKQFTITRTFDAPRNLIWKAWTDPNEVQHWWHPRGVSTPREKVSLDVRAGGSYSYLMVNDANGEEYPTAGTYLEVVEPERLVFTWGSPDDPAETQPVITVTLTDRGEQTEMVFTLVGLDGKPGDGFVYDGWASAFEVLDEHLETEGSLLG